jgi:RNA recognition motif-containing protein
MTIFIANLPYSVTENDLLACFSQYGQVWAVRLGRERGTEKFLGFGFVEMGTYDAELAITGLNGVGWGGRRIRVEAAAQDRRRRVGMPFAGD